MVNGILFKIMVCKNMCHIACASKNTCHIETSHLICIAKVFKWYEILQEGTDFWKNFKDKNKEKFCWSIRTTLFVNTLATLTNTLNSTLPRTHEFASCHSLLIRNNSLYISGKSLEYFKNIFSKNNMEIFSTLLKNKRFYSFP